LLFDALQYTINMCLKIKGRSYKSTNPSQFDWWWLWDYSWVVFICQHQKGSLWCFWNFLFFFKRKIEERKVHNMLSLMLDMYPRFKSLHLLSSLVAMDKLWTLLRNDRLSLYPICLWSVRVIGFCHLNKMKVCVWTYKM